MSGRNVYHLIRLPMEENYDIEEYYISDSDHDFATCWSCGSANCIRYTHEDEETLTSCINAFEHVAEIDEENLVIVFKRDLWLKMIQDIKAKLRKTLEWSDSVFSEACWEINNMIYSISGEYICHSLEPKVHEVDPFNKWLMETLAEEFSEPGVQEVKYKLIQVIDWETY